MTTIFNGTEFVTAPAQARRAAVAAAPAVRTGIAARRSTRRNRRNTRAI